MRTLAGFLVETTNEQLLSATARLDEAGRGVHRATLWGTAERALSTQRDKPHS